MESQELQTIVWDIVDMLSPLTKAKRQEVIDELKTSRPHWFNKQEQEKES